MLPRRYAASAVLRAGRGSARAGRPLPLAPAASARGAERRQPFSGAVATMAASRIRLTADTHKIERDSRFNKVTAEHVAAFREMLGNVESAIIDGVTGPVSGEELEGYNVDWMRKYAGQSRLVLRPGSTEEVSKILAYCNQHRLAVVPQGGNTGLVGGSVPVFDEVVVALGRMNRIRSFDSVTGVLEAEAGVILETADGHVGAHGFAFPLDLGAKGSCQVGGVVATNAGGLRLLRYGSLHGTVLGLEAVLPDGRIVRDMDGLRKNNTGYDVKQLFIGSEGTIGIITGVMVLCPARPKATNVAYLAVESYEAAMETFVAARKQLGEILSAFEMMDGQSQAVVRRVVEEEGGDGESPVGAGSGEGGSHPFYCLIETGGSNEEHDGAKVADFLESVMEAGTVVDGAIAQDVSQAERLWALRERIPECVGRVGGGVYKYDVSVPLEQMYELVHATRARLREKGLYGGEGGDGEQPVVSVIGYGHMGDGNIHLNVGVKEYGGAVEEALEPWVYEWVSGHGGSISAEHGLGLQKKPYVRYSRPEGMVELMREIRAGWDRNGIMNPYKYV